MFESVVQSEARKKSKTKILIVLLLINLCMFAAEAFFGWLSRSAGLIADSIGMLADAIVCAISLSRVRRSLPFNSCAAYLSGGMQLTLGAAMMVEVLRRGLLSDEPDPIYMIFVSFVALLANVACLSIITGSQERHEYLTATWTGSKNDILANVGVIAAGGLVSLTASAVPDLLIGWLISAAVMRRGFLFIAKARKARGYQLD